MKVYPIIPKYSNRKLKEIVRIALVGIFILLLAAATSCKTCKCPAYSEAVTQPVDVKSES